MRKKMNLASVKTHYNEFIDWAEGLYHVSEQEWRSPIGAGKWSAAAVVAHLLFWDKYSLTERFPNFKEDAALPAYPDFQEVNDAAKAHAETYDKNEVIKDLIEFRQQYLNMLDSMTEKHLDMSFSIADNRLTIRDYFHDFIEHDRHHQAQIDKVLKR
jgi:hypothetical protein